MGKRPLIAGVSGVFLTAYALGLVVLPSVFYVGPIETFVGRFTAEPTVLMFLTAVLAIFYLGFLARTRPATSVSEHAGPGHRFEELLDAGPENVTARTRVLAGEPTDREFDAAIESGGRQREVVREFLFETAVAVYTDVTGVERQRAIHAIKNGTWTENEVAAAFLAGPEGPNPGVGQVVRLWLTPKRERAREIRRTLDAIESLSVSEFDGGGWGTARGPPAGTTETASGTQREAYR